MNIYTNIFHSVARESINFADLEVDMWLINGEGLGCIDGDGLINLTGDGAGVLLLF
jgi:hypothetical protein